MLRFGKKMPYKIIYFAKHKKHIEVGSGWIRSFLGHPDPKKMDRIRNTGRNDRRPMRTPSSIKDHRYLQRREIADLSTVT